MAEPWIPLPPEDLGTAEPLRSDLICRSCGYNLRGLVPSGRCPECGTAIGFSLRGDLLRFSDPKWVEAVANGMNWIVAGLVVGLVLGIAAGVAAGVSRSQQYGGLVTAASILGHLVSLIGYWKVTTPDPAETTTTGLNVRLLARCGWIIATSLNIINVSVDMQDPWILLGFASLLFIAAMVAIVGLCVYAAGLARRIPNQGLAQQVYTVMWGLLATQGLALIVVLLVLAISTVGAGVMWSGSGAAASFAIGGLGCFAGLGTLIFGIWAIVLLLRYRNAMSLAAAEARATWAASAPQSDRV